MNVKTALSPLEEEISILLEHTGFELVWLQVLGNSGILRVYVDRPGGVLIEDCALISRQISDLLDNLADAQQFLKNAGLAQGYTLEVSSPGLDRPLVKPAHFTAHLGAEIRLVCNTPFCGPNDKSTTKPRKRWQGILQMATTSGIAFEDQDSKTQVEIDYANIESARLVPDFARSFKYRQS